MRVIILGSGGTSGTLRPNCPTVSGFGAGLYRQRKKWRDDYPALAAVVASHWDERPKKPNDWDLSTIWTRMDYYAKLQRALGTSDYGGKASFELRKALLDVYGKASLRAIGKLLTSGKPFILKQIIEGLKAGDVLVSFNWDTVAERIAEVLRRNLLQAPHPGAGGDIHLIKPHGSLSWLHTFRKGVIYAEPDGRPIIRPVAIRDVVLNQSEPFVLGAVPIKSELLREIQAGCCLAAFELIQAQWRELGRAVAEADEIVVVGYSFPDDDNYGRFLFREAMRRRTKPRPPRVTFYEKAEGKARKSVRRKLKEIFRSRRGPRCIGEVKPP